MGTRDKGLACFLNNEFNYYNHANAELPRDYVAEVEAAPDGSVWFSSSAHQLGGLMHFFGKKIELFTPENSLMNKNMVTGLKMDKNGNLFFATEETVTMPKVFMVDNRKNWKVIGGDVVFYWIAALDVTSESEPDVATDYSLSSCMGCYTNDVAIFRKGKWEKLNTNEFEMDFFNRMFVDKRDFIWVQGSINGDFNSYFVFDGKKWRRSKKNQIPDVFIRSVRVDRHNNIWFCTSEGIFILEQ